MSTCSICVEDSKIPVCCVPCGHVYCQKCITEWQKKCEGSYNCPECREFITNVVLVYIKTDDLKEKVFAENNILKAQLNELEEKARQLETSVTAYNTSLNQKEDRVRYLLKEVKNHRQKASTFQETNKQLEKSLNICNTSLSERKDRLRSLLSELEDKKQMTATCQAEKQHLLEKIRRQQISSQGQNEQLVKDNEALRWTLKLQQEELEYYTAYIGEKLNSTKKTQGCCGSIFAVMVVNVTVLLIFYAGSQNVFIQAVATMLLNIFDCIQTFLTFLLVTLVKLVLIVLAIWVTFKIIKNVVEIIGWLYFGWNVYKAVKYFIHMCKENQPTLSTN